MPPTPLDEVAVAVNTLGQPPLNARRVSPERGACGWYIWGGEGGGRSRTPGFFQTLPVANLIDRCPRIIPFLALAPGWRVRIAADGPEIMPPHHAAVPANVAVRRIGLKTSPPPSVKQWVWLSILLHILAVALFGDTTGGGTRSGEPRGERSVPLSVTFRAPVDRDADAPPRRAATSPGSPKRRIPAAPDAPVTLPPSNAAPDAVVAPPSPAMTTSEERPPAPVMPPVIATEVEKPVTNFVVPAVPVVVPVVIPDPPMRSEPEPATAHLPSSLPSLPRLNAIAPPKAIDPPTVEREVALPTELIPRLIPLNPLTPPGRAERGTPAPVEAPKLKTFVPPHIEPEVVTPPIELPRMVPLAPLTPTQVEREVVRPAELLPRLPPVAPAAPVETVAPAAQVPRVAQPVPAAAADRIAEPARAAPPITPSTPIHTSPPSVLPSASRVAPGAPDGAGTAVVDAPAIAATIPRVPTPSAAGNAPRIDLDAVRQRARELAREGSGPRTLLPFNVRPKEDSRTKEQQAFDKALKRPDCRDAYSGMGLAAVVPLLWDSVSEKGCKW